MTIQDIIKGISVTLSQAFGEVYTIYSEDTEQGMIEPCFFILALTPDQTQVVGNRYYKTNPFVIHYFPTENTNEELNNIANTLFNVLEYITLLDGDLLNGTDMHYEINDGVLKFFVNYNAFVFKVTDAVDSMETVSINTGLKG